MTPLSVLFLGLSIFLSTSRNLFSKKLSLAPFGSKSFFRLQAFLFLAGGIMLLAFHSFSGTFLSSLTLFYAICYGILLLSAQWLYTMAMSQGNVSICSTFYSFGFVIPTLAGVLFWDDTFTLRGGIGIVLVFLSILLSGLNSHQATLQSRKKTYLFPLILAMISSGGLGLMQKIQQCSPFPHESSAFVAVAFLFAGGVSWLVSLPAKNTTDSRGKFPPFIAILTGLAFAGSNLLNTTLAGMVPLTVFSPLLNVGAIVVSTILGSVLFREKPSKKDLVVLLLGILAILLIGL